MTIPLDLNLLESPEKFQQLCFRLTRRAYPDAIPVAISSWDGGRDIVCLKGPDGDVVWQCKFTRRSLAQLKPRVRESLDALNPKRPIQKWILCLSVDVSGNFLDWLETTLESYPFIRTWEPWGRTEILRLLEQSPDIMEVFFYPVWKTLEQRFRVGALELIGFELEEGTGWEVNHRNVLWFGQKVGHDSDLVLDVTVRNRGTISTVINRVSLEVDEVRRQLRALPGAGLMWQQVAYSVSLNNGKPHLGRVKLEPPLEVDAGKHARFAIKLTDVGYAWTGYVRVVLGYSKDKELVLPWMYLVA